MKKIIVVLNKVTPIEKACLRDSLIDFLADDNQSVTAISSDLVEKITVLDVDTSLYQKERENVELRRHERKTIDGMELVEGDKIVTERGACTFKKYDETGIIDTDGGKHYKAIEYYKEPEKIIEAVKKKSFWQFVWKELFR